MKNSKILMILLLFALTLFIVPMMSAAITTALVNPEAGYNYSTSMIVNCTTNIQESTNATLLWSIYGNQTEWRTTPAVGLVETGAISNTSEYYNAAFDISGFADLIMYNFSCLIYNATDYYYTPTAVANVTVDNTIPVTTSSVSLGFIDYMAPNILACTGSDVIDSVVTITRTIHKPDASTVTVTAATYTASGSDTNVLGWYDWNCSILDDSGNVNESILTFNVDSDEIIDGVGDITIDRKDKVGALPIIIIIVFLVVIIVIIIAVAYAKKK